MENTEPNLVFTQRDGGVIHSTCIIGVYYVPGAIGITLSLLLSWLHFSGRDREMSEPLIQRVVKAIMGYAQVPGSI